MPRGHVRTPHRRGRATIDEVRPPRNLVPLALLAGCATTREPLRAPGIDARISYHAGDPIGGTPAPAEVETIELRPADAIAIRGRLHVVDELPGERFQPLTDHVRLIVGEPT